MVADYQDSNPPLKNVDKVVQSHPGSMRVIFVDPCSNGNCFTKDFQYSDGPESTTPRNLWRILFQALDTITCQYFSQLIVNAFQIFLVLIQGITIGLTILPQGLAYAKIAGLPPQVSMDKLR